MARNWERYLDRWLGAGLIEAAAAERIRAWEGDRDKAGGLGWPILLAIALGGLLLSAGILLFVAAHWDNLSPATRFALVLTLTAVVHGGATIAAPRFEILSTTLHAVGTVCLGAGIFLAGQIFHMQEHWPAGVMLWAVGAWAAWAILRDWPQAALAALLTPAWFAGEWSEAVRGFSGGETILCAGMLNLALTYLTAISPDGSSPVRKALAWIGGLAVIPAAVIVVVSTTSRLWGRHELPWSYELLGWAAVFLLPLGVAWLLRGKNAWTNAVAAVWVAALSITGILFRGSRLEFGHGLHHLLIYAVCAVGSVGMIAWGLKEVRRERVNLGVAGFALTVLFFYFSTVMDKMARSASLIGLGILFLLGGWLLEKTRRRLMARMEKGTE